MAKKVFGFRVDTDDDFDDEDDDKSKKGNNEGFIKLFVKTRKISDGVHEIFVTALTKKGPAKDGTEVQILADDEDIEPIKLTKGSGKSKEIRPTKDFVRYTVWCSGTEKTVGLTGPKPTLPPGASTNNKICFAGWMLSLILFIASFVTLVSPIFGRNETGSENGGFQYTPEYGAEQRGSGLALPLSLLGLSIFGFVASAVYTPIAFREEIAYGKRVAKIKTDENKLKSEGKEDKKEDATGGSAVWSLAKKLVSGYWTKSFFVDMLAEYIFSKKK